ncbi:N-acetylglucosamine-6-phosphate deacetylase [Alicyclobacillus contaminans]|uniref:N-acetylglucosamine-6-phosphate deacetylase n=1 Tax=Alicyclobacillus contaminans TaxID=392016 RepID=UPI0003FE8943|nr:N-acetylglucosamine-6-phosphate deacetylase [Alicyclobacillus contaminans]GMA51609.1 N-acetylglucosamine-6-phosphate deacetylase [Alicyclobacillus contaminans]
MTVQNASLLLKNARLVTGAATCQAGWIRLERGMITEVGDGKPPEDMERAVETVDVDGEWVVPGFIDLHVHGADGAEVMDGTPAALRRIGRFHARHGTTGWLPTTLTAPVASILQSLQAARRVQQSPSPDDGARILGVHLEGPFISPRKVGAQNPAHVLAPSVEVMRAFEHVSPGLVKKVTLAPEQPGALALVHWLRERGIIPSIGHTEGTFAEIVRAMEAGATQATHLFNAMTGLHHREGGAAGACLLADDVTCELIADTLHVHPDVMRLVVRVKGPDRIALITDAIAATGRPDGRYRLGELEIVVTEGKSLLKDGHTLAGSTLTMDAAVRNMVSRVGVSLEDAVIMASTTPARELGLGDRKGAIAVGYDADLVVLDENLTVARTFVQGREVYCRR